jgi:hypothetical protein
MLVSKQTQSDFEILEPGTYPAVCTQIVGVGMQVIEYMGEKKEQEKIMLRFEVPSERISWTDGDGNEHEGPAILWTQYTASLGEKANLRRDLESWRGRAFTPEELAGFDLDAVLGKPCMITVVHNEAKNGRVYANIKGVSKLMKGIPVPEAEGDLISFDPDNHAAEEFAALPGWLQAKVEFGLKLKQEQKERLQHGVERLKQQGFREGSHYQDAPTDEFIDDDIPF